MCRGVLSTVDIRDILNLAMKGGGPAALADPVHSLRYE